MHGMVELEHPIDIMELKYKVAEACQERVTPFHEGISGQGWLQWFHN